MQQNFLDYYGKGSKSEVETNRTPRCANMFLEKMATITSGNKTQEMSCLIILAEIILNPFQNWTNKEMSI